VNQSVNGHIASVHEGKKPFKCNICDTSFSQKVNLKRPIVSVHEGNKPVKCNIHGSSQGDCRKEPRRDPLCTKTKINQNS
jgi:uncharacterized Zn-finger protein